MDVWIGGAGIGGCIDWWMYGLVDVWIGRCMDWWMYGLTNVGIDGCIIGGCMD